MTKFIHNIAVPLLLVAALIVTYLIYLPGLSGSFIFDDYINIVNNTDAHINELTVDKLSQALRSGVSSDVSRPLSMLTFGINYYFTELDPYFFKATNVLIHLLISFGIFLLSKEILRIGLPRTVHTERQIALLALFITACWAMHPLNTSTVLYVVQRMNQLSALVGVFTLVYYCKFRQANTRSKLQVFVALGVIACLTIVGVLFKENAVLVVLFVLALEISLLRFKAESEEQRLFLKLFFLLFLAIPAVGAMVLLAISPESVIGNYTNRSFTMWERLLTEARALWVYISWLVMPDTRQFTFYHDNYPISRGLFEPITTLYAVLGVMALIATAWLGRHKFPFLSFGIFFFLAGHALESTFVSLEIMFEHRNYLPGYGILLGGICTLVTLPGYVLSKRTASVFLGLFLLFLAHGTFLEARKWSDTHKQLLSSVRQNPDSHRINYALGFLYLGVASLTPDDPATLDAASYYFNRSAALDSNALRGHVGVILADSQNGKPLDTDIVDQLEFRLRNKKLLENGLTEISMLTECWYGGFCKFDKSILIRFYNAIAANTVIEPVVSQAILDQLGTAIARIFGYKEDGMALLYMAQGKSPDLTIIDIKLIRLEMELMNLTQARELLSNAWAKPGNNFLRQQLQQLSDELGNAE